MIYIIIFYFSLLAACKFGGWGKALLEYDIVLKFVMTGLLSGLCLCTGYFKYISEYVVINLCVCNNSETNL